MALATEEAEMGPTPTIEVLSGADHPRVELLREVLDHRVDLGADLLPSSADDVRRLLLRLFLVFCIDSVAHEERERRRA